MGKVKHGGITRQPRREMEQKIRRQFRVAKTSLMKNARVIAALGSSTHLKSRCRKHIELSRLSTKTRFSRNWRRRGSKRGRNACIGKRLADRLVHGTIALRRTAAGKRNGAGHNEGKRPVSIMIDDAPSGPAADERLPRALVRDLGQRLRIAKADPRTGPTVNPQDRTGNKMQEHLVESHLRGTIPGFAVRKDSQRFKTRKKFQRHRRGLFRPRGRMARNTGTASGVLPPERAQDGGTVHLVNGAKAR